MWWWRLRCRCDCYNVFPTEFVSPDWQQCRRGKCTAPSHPFRPVKTTDAKITSPEGKRPSKNDFVSGLMFTGCRRTFTGRKLVRTGRKQTCQGHELMRPGSKMMYPGHEQTRTSGKTMFASHETTPTERITSVPTCNDGGRGGKKKKSCGSRRLRQSDEKLHPGSQPAPYDAPGTIKNRRSVRFRKRDAGRQKKLPHRCATIGCSRPREQM